MALASSPTSDMAVLTSTHHGMRRRSLLALACCTAFSVGCYRYAPVPVESLTPDMSVRLELSAVAVDRLRRGPDSLARLVDGFTVSGTVSQLRGDSVLLAVPMSFMEANVRLRTQMHDLPILRSDVQGVTSRRLDRARTTWAGVAIGVVAAGAVAYVLNHGGDASGSSSKPTDPSEIRLYPIWQPR
jgi:hypothetical protein